MYFIKIMKNIIIVSIVIGCAALLWGVSFWFAPEKDIATQQEADISQTEKKPLLQVRRKSLRLPRHPSQS